ncbi:MAG TPA: ABC transporter ATP-binding protein [Pyrinomonadaceae bacterium]|jgi:ABC-2 type transport system ATP-binding protein|nr:ABC transporter ATP-binding protein [Pyrinomonadaceae bacterium]
MEYIVEIENLTKDYEVGFFKKKKVRALDGLNLQVEPGQIFGFLGGNGAGKTTTIKLLMGLMFPTSGTARILGEDISSTKMHSRIGYVPENPYFYDYLTARELMMYFAELFGIEPAERKRRSELLLTRVGLEEAAWNRQLRKFSKGMLQRTGLAQSLINDPEIVFMDEPMSGLDPMGRREIRELIAGLREEGKTVFMSTHILSDIEVLCDNVAILRQGKLAATGKLDDLLAQSGETQTFEIHVSGISAESLSKEVSQISGAEIHVTPTGARIDVANETDVDKILPVIRSLSGRLVSVQPVRQSLEELFVKETT